MNRGPRKGIRRGRGTGGIITKIPLKGLFSDGVWKCNCDPRMPASRFQTKNGGKNHNRWFYTCQHPQPTRCDFFLWDDEAKGREATAVLNNSRSEPLGGNGPVTPHKPSPYGLPTPQTDRRIIDLSHDDVQTPYTPSKSPGPKSLYHATKAGDWQGESQAKSATRNHEVEEPSYEWPASDEDDLKMIADQANLTKESAIHPPPETPRKSAKQDSLSTPGKRSYGEINGYPVTGQETLPTPTTGNTNDVFTTPATHKTLFSDAVLPISAETPTPSRYRDIGSVPAEESELATEILASLRIALSAPLFAEARDNIKKICYRHVLYTKGIMKGRDVSRAMVKKKEDTILELQREIEGLKSHREMDRSVIRCLKSELEGSRR